MSDQNTSVHTDEPRLPAAAPKAKSSFGIWLVLLVVVVLAALAFWWQQQELQKLKSGLVTQAAANQQAQRALETRLADNLALQQKQQQGDITELTQRLDSTASKVLALTNLNREDWKLAEVDYLLRMANQRILLEHEAQAPLALAESANAVLAELQSADLFPVRKKLTEEIEALKLANKVDREGIYLQLLALTQQIENLPLIEPLVAEDEETMAAMEQGEEVINPSFGQRIKLFGLRAWHKLSAYVRVRDQGRRVDAILPPEDQMYLKQNLRLMLEQAQIGLLREEQHVYLASLDKAQNWIRDYYPLNDQAQIVLNDLDQMKKNNVQQPLPDFSGSAALVKDYLRQKDRLAFSRQGGK